MLVSFNNKTDYFMTISYFRREVTRRDVLVVIYELRAPIFPFKMWEGEWYNNHIEKMQLLFSSVVPGMKALQVTTIG